MSKNKLTIEKAHSDMWRVEMRDHHSNYTCVYEPSVKQAMQYALYWFEKADEREEANAIHGKAIKEMIDIDIENGITPSLD